MPAISAIRRRVIGTLHSVPDPSTFSEEDLSLDEDGDRSIAIAMERVKLVRDAPTFRMR